MFERKKQDRFKGVKNWQMYKDVNGVQKIVLQSKKHLT